MKQVHVFTCAAFNYIPKVRMLFRSLRELHPDWILHLALADERRPEIDLTSEPFDHVLSVDMLDIPAWKGWAFCHTIVELATAIKPFALAKLLKLPDTAKVIYLDPDTVAFSRLDDILAALDEGNIVLTPHQTTPEKTLTAIIDNEVSSLRHGIYNLGFIGVAATEVGLAFADWWSQRLYYFCRADIPKGLFTDQRWIDLVPAFFEGVAIMRSSRHNVAPWNLTTRIVQKDAQGKYLVDGEPLGFYHFTGFDSGAHRTMSIKNSRGSSGIDELVSWYVTQTRDLSKDPLANVPWAFGTYSNGDLITKAQRVVYRERADLQAAYPNPFEASGYLIWWKTKAKNEYPGLFEANDQANELSRIFPILRPGFNAHAGGIDFGVTGRLIKYAMTQPADGIKIAKRGWEILRNEGLVGIKRRLGG